MNDAALFDATIPVLRHYLQRIEALLGVIPERQLGLLDQSLAPGAFSAAQHLRTALGFVTRTLGPFIDRTQPPSEDDVLDRDGLRKLVRTLDTFLKGITVDEFDGADGRRVSHTAGDAELDQDATTFVTLFAMPSFFFHLTMAFAIFRSGGIDIGKADFDAQHLYAKGFRF